MTHISSVSCVGLAVFLIGILIVTFGVGVHYRRKFSNKILFGGLCFLFLGLAIISLGAPPKSKAHKTWRAVPVESLTAGTYEYEGPWVQNGVIVAAVRPIRMTDSLARSDDGVAMPLCKEWRLCTFEHGTYGIEALTESSNRIGTGTFTVSTKDHFFDVIAVSF